MLPKRRFSKPRKSGDRERCQWCTS
jgi:hypothetical protein